MILSTNAVAELKSEWAGVVKMRDRMKTVVIVTFAGGALTGSALRDIVYNLPLLLAFDVLKQTLTKAKYEGLLKCPKKTSSLGGLMKCAEHSLSIQWIDWDTLHEGKCRRNAVAHDGELFGQKQCLQDIASVEDQLRAWKIIDPT